MSTRTSTAVCIAGMHRSGTSMIARLLHACGVYLGTEQDLLRPQPDNPEGFWENENLVLLNERLLNEFGGAWDAPPVSPWNGQLDSPAAVALAEEGRRLLAPFVGQPVWGWKDPRNSLTLPFWRRLVPGMKLVVCLRNPLEVAASLHARNYFSITAGLRMWREYNRRLMESSGPGERVVTHYDAYFHRAGEELRRVLTFLGVEAPEDAVARSAACATPDRRHNYFAAADLAAAGVAPDVAELYERMCAEAGWRDAAGPAGVPHLPREDTGGTKGLREVDSAAIELTLLRRTVEERTVWAQKTAAELAERDERIRALESRLTVLGEQAAAVRQDEQKKEDEKREEQPAAGRAASDERLAALEYKVTALTAVLSARDAEMLTVLEDLHHGFAHLKGAGEAAEELQYRQLVRRVRKTVDARLPPDANVVVVSKGDDLFLELNGRPASHFPQDREGHYAGFNPADSGSAVVQLEALRAQGAQYFLLPSSSLWWLDHYKGLRRHLERHYRILLRDNDVAAIYSLVEPPVAGVVGGAAGVVTAMAAVIAEFVRRFDREPAILDWNTGLKLAAAFPERSVFSPPGGSAPAQLPYLDQTIDIVTVASSHPAVMAEAGRIAGAAVVSFPPLSGDPAAVPQVRWLLESTAPPLPSVSVVIPSYNGAALTEACLKALEETLPADFHGEVIVVDDCSTDDTQGRLGPWAQGERGGRLNLKLLRNPQNSGFVSTCNNGAAAASCDVIILMNNDTLPQRGWLEPLLRTFRNHADAGAVGCKLVYPDGRLQEAGGVVFDDGSAANFGKFEHQLDLPLYNYVREVDYVTGALIATPRTLFNELGGLDTRYKPIYYEETDYCFKLRQRGFKVYYQPESVVIHLEGVTCGTDPNSGLKRYQVVNREKFVERWRSELRRQPPGPGRFNRATWHALAVRGWTGPEAPEERDGSRAAPAGSNGGGR